MRKYLVSSSLPFIFLMIFTACNVEEWPKEVEERYSFTLSMDFDRELPLHKEVYYSRSGDKFTDDTRGEDLNYDIRYLVNVYKVKDENDPSREVYVTYTFSKKYEESHNHQVQLYLPPGNYRFRIWSDHVTTGTQDDLFYSTVDFAEIKINGKPGHPGSNEFRDAFRGSAYASIYDPELYKLQYGEDPENSATAQMKRPMGRYEFVSTDMDEFLDKIIENLDTRTLQELLTKAESTRGATRGDDFWNGLTRNEVAEVIGLDEYTVVYSYNAFMPSSYNIYTDKPSDSSTGVNFESKMQIGNEGMGLGFDYILVDNETTMNLNMAIYNGNGDLVASTTGIEVPVSRSKNTIVKGTFLTVSSGGGVSINPDYDGEFNIEIK